MEKQQNEIEINGSVYILKSTVSNSNLSPNVDGKQFVMVRTYSAGVHFGYLSERNGKEVKLLNSVRVWYWSGAASLSQLATEGTKKSSDCKFAIAVPEITLTEAIEIIPITEVAANNLKSVKTWKM